MADRMARLEAYESSFVATRIKFEEILGQDELEAYWRLLEKVNADLREYQKVANGLREKVVNALRPK